MGDLSFYDDSHSHKLPVVRSDSRLEVILERKLYLARSRADRVATRPPEKRVCDRGARCQAIFRQPERRRVGCVLHLEPVLEVVILGDPHSLADRQVELEKRGHREEVSTGVSELTRRRNREYAAGVGCGIKGGASGWKAEVEFRPRCRLEYSPNHVGSACTAFRRRLDNAAEGVRAGEDCERPAGRPHRGAGQSPTAGDAFENRMPVTSPAPPSAKRQIVD